MKTNYLAIAACALVNIALGMGWYGAFSQPWMDGHGLTMEDATSMENPYLPHIVGVATALTFGFLLTMIFRRMGVGGWIDGAMTGAAIGLFGLLGTIVGNMYSMSPFSLSLIDGGYAFLQFVIFGAIIGGWQKR